MQLGLGPAIYPQRPGQIECDVCCFFSTILSINMLLAKPSLIGLHSSLSVLYEKWRMQVWREVQIPSPHQSIRSHTVGQGIPTRKREAHSCRSS